ncbi:MAG: glycosyltransferase [Kaistella sp.]
MFQGKTIFVSPMDWGLGHPSRCVPIIHGLKTHYKIILGVTPLTKIIFDEEFPDLEKINVPSYNIKYSSILPLSIKLLSDWPKISGVIKEEHALLDKLITEHKIDSVVSDNRFGMYSKKIHSVFITHQMFLKAPFANSLAQNKNKKFILNFNEIWVPDSEDETKSLAGELSHGKHFHEKISYIGPKSRLRKLPSTKKEIDCLFLLSGPQPELSNFATILLDKAKENPELKFAFVSPEAHGTNSKNLETFISPSKEQLSQLIADSEKIICRSGYSTLMDLHHLQKKNIILVPTPGQTEQEYLAKYWEKKFGTTRILQNKLKKFVFKF